MGPRAQEVPIDAGAVAKRHGRSRYLASSDGSPSADTAFRSGRGDQPKYFRVPMVLRRRAEEVARRVWGDDGDRRALRDGAREEEAAATAADAAARRKAHTKCVDSRVP